VKAIIENFGNSRKAMSRPDRLEGLVFGRGGIALRLGSLAGECLEARHCVGKPGWRSKKICGGFSKYPVVALHWYNRC
jgi:hypothetical protein